jgi:hypothetical protein
VDNNGHQDFCSNFTSVAFEFVGIITLVGGINEAGKRGDQYTNNIRRDSHNQPR